VEAFDGHLVRNSVFDFDRDGHAVGNERRCANPEAYWTAKQASGLGQGRILACRRVSRPAAAAFVDGSNCSCMALAATWEVTLSILAARPCVPITWTRNPFEKVSPHTAGVGAHRLGKPALALTIFAFC
jgi:hypothetical protein